MNKSKFFFRLLILIILIGLLVPGKISSAAAENKKAYIIVVNKYTLDDIEIMPNLKGILNEGSIGLMNTRGLYGYNTPESYLTINSSKKAYTTDEGALAYDLIEINKEVYERRIGKIVGEYKVANINLSNILEHNEKNSYNPHIGALGDNIHSSSLKTAIIGNADILDKDFRPSSLIPMDSKGLIDLGSVENMLIEDSEFPYGFRTDYDLLLEEIGEVKDEASLIVVDTGDLDRLSRYSKELTDELFAYQRGKILSNIDNFIGELKSNIDKNNSILIIISPNSGEDRVDNSKLSPLILWGEGIKTGILSSPTTKREGVVANIDIGPTVLDYLGCPKENMSGNGIKTIEMKNGFENIRYTQNRINVVSNSRFNILAVYCVIIIIGLILSTLLLTFKIKVEGNLYSIVYLFLIVIGVLPIGFLISSIFKWESYFGYIITILSISIVLTFILFRLKHINTIFYISGILYLIICVDVMTGGNLIRYSSLGYDPTIGARYFGLGNELVGLFLGVSVVFASGVANKMKNFKLSYLLLIISAIIAGYPKLGANVGGAIALIFTMLYFIFEGVDIEISIARIIGIGFIVLILIVFLAYIDINFNQNPTHLGKLFLTSSSSEKSITNNIVIRKLLMNIKLVGSSIWTRVLLTNIICQVLLLITWGADIRKLYDENKASFMALCSGVVGSIMGFLANDSGIILASISMTFVTLYFIFIVIEISQHKQETWE